MSSRRGRVPPAPPISLALQVLYMKERFPGFVFQAKGREAGVWLGTLQPSPESSRYTVRIEYFTGKAPRVYVTDPMILPKAPHRYPEDGSLCLYDPRDGDYRIGRSLVAATIVPWAAEWLYYYEAWLTTGVWWGPEAPHFPPGN